MKKIRYGMFETNSSSTHTIIVTKTKTDPGLMVDFSIGEFGWELRKLDTINEKASYLYTLGCDLLGRDVYQDFYEILVKYGVECTCSIHAEFRKTSYGEYLDNGYVDHAENARNFLENMMKHEHSLIKFLFSDESAVYMSNDNMFSEDNPYLGISEELHYPHTTYYKGN